MIRSVEPKDKDVYLDLVRAFYQSEAVLHSIPDEYIENTWNELMSSSDYVKAYILESDNQVAGYALLSFTFSQEVGGKVAWLEELFMLPEFRGQGLGKEFFAFMEANVESKVSRIRLEVEPDNNRAKRLYESLGYEDLPYVQMVKE
ncbi:GNAT superfamily N-acetyltransferase [Lachnospiraceae bacterium PM6-15]|uniref:GNAT family N-acetyltransferase n=1 Tax=Ohessyouella blattaphilus TaxID=2949333 RepID=A0ABT1EI76_9FIRM|nr:GNAT family N-acetyltransferase [Ohessyouella blattaphilus]MCP1110179.1 GNAT family N-acetyltransferase [Ohessyouella blattaphilus]MCR8563573.1 GNAT family N-acetyltransferase [Ohessyouella blattaphilus]